MTYSVESLKKMRRNAKKSQKEYTKRKDEVKRVYENGYKFDDYYLDIKKNIDACSFELSKGIKGIPMLNEKCATITAESESQCLSSQYQFSSALLGLSQDISRCETNIEYYEKKIVEYEQQIKEQGGSIFPWE